MDAAVWWVVALVMGVAFVREWRAARRLRFIVEGRAKPPSVEELRAHAAAHPWKGDRTIGRWLVKAPNASNGAEASGVLLLRCLPDGRCFWNDDGAWKELPDNPSGKHAPGSRWWPLTCEGAPCAIPRAA